MYLKNVNSNKTPINIFLGLSKAFETLDQNILLSKLKHHGINGTSLNLMESYLSNKKQYVLLNDTNTISDYYKRCATMFHTRSTSLHNIHK